MVSFDEVQPGLVVVTYRLAEDLAVSAQATLLARLQEKRGPVVLVFDVGAAVRSVPMDVPNFWLGVTARPELRLTGMAIVTKSIGVRVAAKGFALANTARSISTRVDTFAELEQALTWSRALLG
jgi:hypothetical protein